MNAMRENRWRRWGRLGACGALVLAIGTPALAHGDASSDAQMLGTWPLSADIVVPTLLFVLVYARGMARLFVRGNTPWYRHVLFFGGAMALFFALQSPIDLAAERLFWVHQIQHLLLRMIGPMLLALAWPQGVLIAGLPVSIRQKILAPIVSSPWVQKSFALIAHPVAATSIFIGALYFWEIPRVHDFALLNEPVHYVMHVTMLLAGLVFWWRIFDRRPAPKGLRYGVRLMMLWLAVLSNIALGAYTSLKNVVLYPAYDTPPGRLFDFGALGDEKLGGIIIWIPSSMMILIAVIIVIHMLGRHEASQDKQRLARFAANGVSATHPATGAQLVAQTRPRNRALAIGFALFATTIFASAILVGVAAQMSHQQGQSAKTGAGAANLTGLHTARSGGPLPKGQSHANGAVQPPSS